MSHLDEGTLHALLDGELDLAEVSEIQMHLGSCVACGSRLQEVKQVLAEADRLVGTVEVPAGAATPPPAQRPLSRPSPPPLSQPRDPGIWDEAPVLLVPDPIDASARRKKWIRGIGIAAALGLMVGGGKLVTDALKPGHPVLPERDLTTAAPPVAPAVASPQETRKPQALATRDRAPAQGRPQTPPPAAKAAPVTRRPPVDTSDQLADTATTAADDSVAADLALGDTTGSAAGGVGVAGAAVAGAAVPGAAESKAGSTSTQRVANTRTDSTTAASRQSNEDDAATRAAAAAALAELDRQRRRERANAATAALPPTARPQAEVVESTPAPAPRVPTLEERAQIYLRIGLDEAVRQLGGPVHVIEGMTPQFIGMVRGQQVPGASPRRPVVRVVYLDPRGRMILLDQQRLDPSQAPGSVSGNLRWVIGDVMLYLRGEPSPDVLRSLQARVR
jgi:hypothetical protein